MSCQVGNPAGVFKATYCRPSVFENLLIPQLECHHGSPRRSYMFSGSKTLPKYIRSTGFSMPHHHTPTPLSVPEQHSQVAVELIFRHPSPGSRRFQLESGGGYRSSKGLVLRMWPRLLIIHTKQCMEPFQN